MLVVYDVKLYALAIAQYGLGTNISGKLGLRGGKHQTLSLFVYIHYTYNLAPLKEHYNYNILA